MRIPPPAARRRARIEIIPLIDIIFFLLATFVMVSLSMVKNRSLPVDLPSAATAVRPERTSSVAVTVTQAGEIYLDKQRMSFKELSARLSKLQKGEPDLKVFLYGDERADFGSVLHVLDEVKGLGIRKAFIQTKPLSGSGDAA